MERKEKRVGRGNGWRFLTQGSIAAKSSVESLWVFLSDRAREDLFFWHCAPVTSVQAETDVAYESAS